MLFAASWISSDNKTCRGFLKAKDMIDAHGILKTMLKPDCIVKTITEAYEHQITPQSLTINFANTTDYELFG